ncbi:MAG: hypothetical protein B9S32_13750 [Verrucomicrobia bacterium Tous-C9LFEB]|nr:MAG: hypothetical protein B9S32_13750 [Verrucomicrobia bacterium Tous-C9LFEB]
MKRDELWKVYVAKNPVFAAPDATVTLTARGLKKMFEQTYDHGFKAGVRSGMTLERGLSSFKSGLFGKKS